MLGNCWLIALVGAFLHHTWYTASACAFFCLTYTWCIASAGAYCDTNSALHLLAPYYVTHDALHPLTSRYITLSALLHEKYFHVI